MLSQGIRRREWLVLAAIVALAMAIRLHAAAQPRVAWGDEPIYLWAGQSLLDGTGYNAWGYSGAHMPPLFAVAAAGLAPLVGGLLNASNLVYVIAGSLLVVPLYLLARALYGQPAAWMTGLVVALYPALVTGVLEWGTMTEPLYLLWVGIAIYALYLALEHGGTRHYALLGVALGLAYLTRTEALVFATAALVLLLVGRLLRRDRLAPLLGRLAITAGLFLLLTSPYLLYIHNTTGRWSLTGAAGMAYTTMTGLGERDPAAFDRATWGLDEPSGEVYYFAPSSEAQPLAAVLLNDPSGLIRRLRSGLKEAANLLFSVRLVPWILASLLFLGLFAQPWSAPRLRGELALIASLAAPASYIAFFVQDRYLAGALLPAMVWIGAGAWLLGCWLAGTVQNPLQRPLPAAARRALLVAPALLLALTLVNLEPRVWNALQHTHSFQPGHLAAAAELRGRGAPADAVVMSRYPAIAFHAGTRWAATPAEDWPTVLAYARQRDARYLAIDGWEAQLRPQLAFLLDPSQAPPELRYLATVQPVDIPVVIYEFIQ
jgi:4-amino-4-deoxy-L-arabinose transferase-like glycosyltransferase